MAADGLRQAGRGAGAGVCRTRPDGSAVAFSRRLERGVELLRPGHLQHCQRLHERHQRLYPAGREADAGVSAVGLFARPLAARGRGFAGGGIFDDVERAARGGARARTRYLWGRAAGASSPHRPADDITRAGRTEFKGHYDGSDRRLRRCHRSGDAGDAGVEQLGCLRQAVRNR